MSRVGLLPSRRWADRFASVPHYLRFKDVMVERHPSEPQKNHELSTQTQGLEFQHELLKPKPHRRLEVVYSIILKKSLSVIIPTSLSFFTTGMAPMFFSRIILAV